MKILQLNVWMGRISGNLLRFLENTNFDVICMQEVVRSEDRAMHLSRFCATLPAIKAASGLEFDYFSPNWGTEIANGGTMQLGNLVLSRVPIQDKQTVFVNKAYKENLILEAQPSNISNLQIIRLETGLTVANHHGYWHKNPMGDENSIATMRHVAAELKKINGPLVFCGDLNVIGESPVMRNLDFLTDLTVTNSAKSTLSGIGFNGNVPCDHILVSDSLQATDFQIHHEIVSDHLAISTRIN